ncbi:BlaI/MecI/CopY family transcriptional regulator [Murimonas intestini]|uniref:BlaI/MecI/CopY family transcriptional regulator n=1 Tax=Murimonas intestini TaxID=1337051 RepID=UPI0011DD5BD1|nr:BlaI/MecI/CopY family transcriptional regulator [Murimonas intestini]
MDIKLFDSELKVMEVLWKEGELPAGQIARILKEETGWNRNTTYTVIKKCVEKGAVQRREPNFICSPLVTKEQVQSQETEELIDKMFDGSREDFFASFVNMISEDEARKLRNMIDKM